MRQSDSSYGYDIDNPNGADYCRKTDYYSDGARSEYSATNGDFGIGHGHKVIDSQGNEPYNRSPSDPKSVGRAWYERN